MDSVTSAHRDVALLPRLLGLHGVALSCGLPIVDRRPSIAVVGALALAFAPFLAWAFGPERWRRLPWLGFGVVPFGMMSSAALLEATSDGALERLGAVRVTAGVLAQLAASALLDTRPRVQVEVEVSDRPAAPDPAARARRRVVFLSALALGLSAIVLVGPAMRPDTTAAERAFAALVGSVLGATIALTVVPNAMRREKRPSARRSRGVRLAITFVVVALCALAIEWWTRS